MTEFADVDWSAGAKHDAPADAVDAPRISRKDFLAMFGADYRSGQHATFLGPTQRGKTTLAFQCLKTVISPKHKALVLASKPKGRDHMMEEVPKDLNLRVIHHWPPDYAPIADRKKNGWVLKPNQRMRNPDEDNAILKTEFRAAILGAYRTSKDKPIITLADEAALIQYDLQLKKECDQALMRGAPVNAMWTIAQRGRWLSYHVYDAAEHLFIFYDPDLSNQARYGEIGGADKREIMRLTASLQTKRLENGRTVSECLYIKRAGPEFFIIETN